MTTNANRARRFAHEDRIQTLKSTLLRGECLLDAKCEQVEQLSETVRFYRKKSTRDDRILKKYRERAARQQLTIARNRHIIAHQRSLIGSMQLQVGNMQRDIGNMRHQVKNMESKISGLRQQRKTMYTRFATSEERVAVAKAAILTLSDSSRKQLTMSQMQISCVKEDANRHLRTTQTLAEVLASVNRDVHLLRDAIVDSFNRVLTKAIV